MRSTLPLPIHTNLEIGFEHEINALTVPHHVALDLHQIPDLLLALVRVPQIWQFQRLIRQQDRCMLPQSCLKWQHRGHIHHLMAISGNF